ncbi:hypothetical protein [Yersinia alsatica]|uniref:hypothetical protein n=1 Tax=Yersinia alsatica TaxID=2890317 RepID=UPI001643B532|nr:hypothetical protein [Yersinia alsatica]
MLAHTLDNPALARNIALRVNLLCLSGLTSQRDGHPCPSALFAGVHASSLYPPSLSAIFLIALNIKVQKTWFAGFDVKSTFEQPSEECSQGNPPWMAG